MKYQHPHNGAQASDTPRLADANINPVTGFATDYLNHFNEAIMLLDMMAACPDCAADFMSWRAVSYREHFAASHFKGRDLAISAYEAADPALRGCLEALVTAMTAQLEATRDALRVGMPEAAAGALAARTAASLKPLVAHAGAVINGENRGEIRDAVPRQAMIDRLMDR